MSSLTNLFNITTMNAKELYRELQNPMYDEYPYSGLKDLGEGMAVVEEVIYNYWRERFLVNHEAAEAYELMDRDLTLTFLTEDDVDWDGVETLKNNRNAYSFSAYYQIFGLYKFVNGVTLVRWTLYPDGMYFMDEDGYGMEDNEESVLYGFIDKKARVVIPFQAKSEREMKTLRAEAEQRAMN